MNVKDILNCFFRVLYPGSIPKKSAAEMIYKQAAKLINKGWTYANITNRIIDYKENNKNIKSVDLFKIIDKNETPPLCKEGNLLENKFYYHNRLQKTSSPTEVEITVSGEVIKRSEPFYLEMIEYFSVTDLTDYFHQTMQIDDNNLYKLNQGGFKKIANDYRVDLLLFTIDQAYKILNYNNRSLLKNYSSLYQYLDHGQEQMNKAKNSSTNKIKPYYNAYLKMRGGGGNE